jgi:hypothetical protein
MDTSKISMIHGDDGSYVFADEKGNGIRVAGTNDPRTYTATATFRVGDEEYTLVREATLYPDAIFDDEAARELASAAAKHLVRLVIAEFENDSQQEMTRH